MFKISKQNTSKKTIMFPYFIVTKTKSVVEKYTELNFAYLLKASIS